VYRVALHFGFLERACSHDTASGAVRFQRACQRVASRQSYNGLKHFDDVFDRVIFVVENNDVIKGLRLS
jgi:hypothetical protein